MRTLNDDQDHPEHHSFQTILKRLTHRIRPSRLDLRRVNALTQTRFDADKTAYIRNLGNGILMLRGRGGTGKTFALVQIALHLARQGKRTILLTYNHGLIADISRALQFIAEDEPMLANVLPELSTRYAFIRRIFGQTRFYDDDHEDGEIHSTVDDLPLDKREDARVKLLMRNDTVAEPRFEYALVDEGQDWTEEQRDLMFKLFGPGNVIVADGVDQFVGQDRCNWDRGDIPINRRHGLRTSRRTKGATCQTVSEIAHELGLSDWDLEPDPDAYGGRFTVLVEPDARRAVTRGIEILDEDQRAEPDLRPVDNLVCLPSSKIAGGINYPVLFDRAIEAAQGDSWRGFDEEDRRIYPLRPTQLRAIQYHSCRGMEGWTNLCLALDQFFNFQIANPRLNKAQIEASLRAQHGMFFKNEMLGPAYEQEARLFAINWLMIPLTRSIDHLVIHLTNGQSELGRVLRKVSARCPGAIEWRGSE